ncbi:ATP-dependent DNA helicase PIF1-like protein [Tanacetum coccineum]
MTTPFRMWDVNAVTGRYLSMNFVVYDVKVYLSSTSSIVIFDDAAIPAIKALKKANSVVEQHNSATPDDLSQPWDGTLENLLILSPSTVRKIDYPVLRYMLEFDVSDDTTHVVVVMFSETATSLVKCFADSLMDVADEINPSDGIEDSVGSSTLDAVVENQTHKLKRLARHPSIATPSKPIEERKSKRTDVEDSDTEDSDDLANGTRKNKVIQLSDKKKRNQWSLMIPTQMLAAVQAKWARRARLPLILLRRKGSGSLADRMVNPTLSNMLNKSVFMTSNTIIGEDGKVHSYCGLRLVEIPASGSGLKQHEHLQLRGTHIPVAEGDPHVFTLPNGVPGIYHNLGPPSYQCSMFNVAMWYDERTDKNEIRNRMSAFMSKETPKTVDNSGQPDLIRTATRQYNAHTVSEVAALIINDFGDGLPSRDIVVNKNTGPQRISELHPSYMVLQYPLLFPYSEDGYHEKIPYYINGGSQKTKRGYQYLVDAFTAIEEQQLKWIRNNQDMLRLDLYHNLCDAVTRGETSTVGLGKRIVLLWTFTGSPRYMIQNYQDAMALCRAYGNPDMFITFTSNLKRPEIAEMLAYMTDEKLRNYCLLEIQELLNRHGRSLTDFKDLPQPNPKLLTNLNNRLIREALAFMVNKSKVEYEQLHSMLNPEQRLIYEKVIESVHNDRGQFYFIHGSEGTRKTFLYKTIIARLRTAQMSVLVVASSGIASLLLPAGRTTHSRFVIPLELMENSICGIKQNTHLAELMQQVQLIIWDEAPMTQRYAFEALDKMLQDILGYKNLGKRNRIFGGMTHTVNEYTRNGEIDTRKQNFNRWGLAVGDDKLPAKKKEMKDEPTWIEIPEELLIKSWTTPIEQIVSDTYLDFTSRQTNDEYLKERAILTPKE